MVSNALNPKKYGKCRILPFLITLATGLRIIMFAFQYNPCGDDGARYFQETRNLVYHHVFSSLQDGAPTAHDLPLWPALMAVFLRISDSESCAILMAGLTNLLLFCGCIHLLMNILRDAPFYCDSNGVAYALLIFMFMPGSFCYSLFIMPDQIAVFLLLLGLRFYYLGIFHTENRLYGTAAAWGAAILAKPICLPLTCAFFIALLFVLKGSIFRRVATVLAVFAISAAILSPWIIRNKHVFGTAGLTTISGTNLYQCNWKWMLSSWSGSKKKTAEEADARFEAELKKNHPDPIAASRAYEKYARHQILSHLPDYCLYTLKAHPRLYCGSGIAAFLSYFTDIDYQKKHGFFSRKPGTGILRYGVIAALVVLSFLWLAACYAIILLGTATAAKYIMAVRRKHPRYGKKMLTGYLSVLMSLALIALVLGPVVTTRYRFIMIPFFAVLASYLGVRPRLRSRLGHTPPAPGDSNHL